jgi:transcriptional regulator with XRE-family HTH domain
LEYKPITLKNTNPASILLTPQEGNFIRRLIDAKGLKQYEYAKEVGIAPAHLSTYLGGNKALTIDSLNRLLSGLPYICQCTLQLLPIQTGVLAQDANFIPLEDQLSYEEVDMLPTAPSALSE